MRIGGLGPSAAQTIRAAAELVARQSAATSAPIAVWRHIEESAEAFARRVSAIRAQRSGRTLAAVPVGFDVPDGVEAVEFPERHFKALHPQRRARYRVLHGGRASAKSWSIARAFILMAIMQPVRVLCGREFQNSLDESVHRLLTDVIGEMRLDPWFTVLRDGITSHIGAEFSYIGFRHNTSKVRSFEGATHCWIEEAVAISDNSLQVLVPTIRKKGSELWFSFNPDQESDPVYQRFVISPPPSAIVEAVSWRDNPWLSPEMIAEREYLLRVDPDAESWVWGGACRQISDAQVLKGKYAIEPFTPADDWSGPYFGADWGFSQDPTTLVRMWVSGQTLYVDHEVYAVGVDIDRLPALFDQVPGAREHVIRADSARPETISFMQQHGFGKITAVEKWSGSVEDGIAHLRSFERVVVHPRCEHVAQEMRLYSYKVDRLTGNVLPKLVDRHNHCIDAIRYALAPLMKRAGGGLLDYYRALSAERASNCPPQVGTIVPLG